MSVSFCMLIEFWSKIFQEDDVKRSQVVYGFGLEASNDESGAIMLLPS